MSQPQSFFFILRDSLVLFGATGPLPNLQISMSANGDWQKTHSGAYAQTRARRCNGSSDDR
jgi:hypothetical protein